MATDSTDLSRLFRDRRLNAGLGWLFVTLIAAVSLAELVVNGDVLSAVFGGAVVVLAVVPAVAHRSSLVMLPWEVIAMASLPTVGRAVATWALGGELATYLAVAAVALIVAVELHAFTEVEMTYGFAVLFVVVTTMAAAGVWAVARWLFDLSFGTGFIESEEALMWEFVYSTAAGLLAGGVFRAYFGRRAYADRLPEAAENPALPGDAKATPGPDRGGEA